MSSIPQLPLSEQKKIAAWKACRPLDGHSPAAYRIDAYGNLIVWSHYGTQGDHGWEIDHIHPSALGGTDGLHNLRALHWQKNRQLGGHLARAINAFNQSRPMTNPINAFKPERR